MEWDAVDVVPYKPAHSLVNKDIRNKIGKKRFPAVFIAGGNSMFSLLPDSGS